MKKFLSLSLKGRESLYATVLLFYLLPVLLFSKHSIGLMSANKSWSVISLGLVISLFGSALFIVLIKNWEEAVREKSLAKIKVTSPVFAEEKITPLNSYESDEQLVTLETALDESQQQSQQLASELQTQNEHLRQVTEEGGLCRQRLETLKKEYEEYRHNIEHSMVQGNQELSQAKERLEQMARQVEEQSRLNSELESKNRDLSYEVKTLLELEDRESASSARASSAESFHPVMAAFADGGEDLHAASADELTAVSSERQVHSPYDAVLELQRCIDIAKDLKGAAHLSDGSSRLGADAYAIDLRRLFDKFRHETSSPIVLYNPSEEKVLFASNQVTGILGWSPEKFASDFFSLLQEGSEQWREASKSLDGTNHQTVSLVIKTETAATDALVHGYINSVPSGPFANHVIGVFLPA